MIQTKADLAFYLAEDRKAQHLPAYDSLKARIMGLIIPNYSWLFMECFRKLEYWANQKKVGLWGHLMRLHYQRKFLKLSVATGISCSINTIGAGTWFNHGKVLVSMYAKIGENCKILSDVTIGGQGRYDKAKAATIGNRVFIGSGAKLVGDIEIADDCVIGANAVVTKSFTEPGVTIAGIPAHKVSNEGSYYYLNAV